MPLHAERRGTGPRVVLVHGFTQTRRCWGPVVEELAVDHEVVVVDAPGHGRSAAVRSDLREGAAALVDACGPATYLGYSMGARFSLHVALHHPESVHGLVLLGGTAGIEDDQERTRRREQDLATAERLRAVGVERFVREWLEQPLFASLPRDRACVEERLENTVEGLASSLELVGTGSQDPTWDALHRIDAPVLALAGEQDSRFARLAERMAAGIGANAEASVVPGAGHTAHLEQPEAFVRVLRDWLARRAL